jgi:hypothetical protein
MLPITGLAQVCCLMGSAVMDTGTGCCSREMNLLFRDSCLCVFCYIIGICAGCLLSVYVRVMSDV